METHLETDYLSHNKIPPILLISQMAAGSLYIRNELQEQLKLPLRSEVSCGPDIYGTIILSRLKKLEELGGIVYSHLYPTEVNKHILNNSKLEKLIVNVRDPRQATLSCLHFFDSVKNNPRSQGMLLTHIGQSFYELSFEKKIEYMIDLWLPRLVEFVENWLDASEDENFKLKVKLTRFEDLKTNYDKFFREIVEFLELDPQRFKGKERVYDQGEAAFRKGLLDEWRGVFSTKQCEKATSMVPERLYHYFGWIK